MKRTWILLVVCAVFPALAGCSYYKIRDPASDKIYYTSDYHRVGSGAIRFKDTVTRQKITLSSSEVIKISRDQYKANIHGR